MKEGEMRRRGEEREIEEMEVKVEGGGEKEREERERVPDEARKREGGREDVDRMNEMEEKETFSPSIVNREGEGEEEEEKEEREETSLRVIEDEVCD